MSSIQIAIIKSQKDNRRHLLPSINNDIGIVGYFSSVDSLVEATNKHIDIILINIDDTHSLHTITHLLKTFVKSRIIAICSPSNQQYTQNLIHMGIPGVILESEIIENFDNIIRTIHSGHIVISQAILQNILTKKTIC